MIIKTLIRQNEYKDSVLLMKAASLASQLEGIETASIMMATENNKKILAESELLTPEALKASANDIVIVVKAVNEDIADKGLVKIQKTLNEAATGIIDTNHYFKSTRGALNSVEEANLVVISVPGEYAAREARVALDAGRNVFLFSDNVSLDEEIELKNLAKEKGLILMGPDCGTSIIQGKAIGFANAVRQGSIGIVGASGTGLQEVTTLIHHLGRGVSHAIGTGSRDIKDQIGGISMLTGLNALDADPMTKTIVIVSKPPQSNTLEIILRQAKKVSKPVIINFLGIDIERIEQYNLIAAPTLESAAYMACSIDKEPSNNLNRFNSWVFDSPREEIEFMLEKEISNLKESQQYIRGLYVGGTFTSETSQILVEILNDSLHSNISGQNIKSLPNLHQSKAHTIIDLGDDTFTVGKPHPMIDQSYRKFRLIQDATDPTTAVIILDFVLGFGAHPDPILDIIPTLKKVRSQQNYITIIAHVCGTDLDPQDYINSLKKLRELDVIIMPTNAQAARFAALVASRGEAKIWRDKDG